MFGEAKIRAVEELISVKSTSREKSLCEGKVASLENSFLEYTTDINIFSF